MRFFICEQQQDKSNPIYPDSNMYVCNIYNNIWKEQRTDVFSVPSF